MAADEHLNETQFRTLYHGTGPVSAEGIRETGLRPSKGKIGIQSISGTLTDKREEAEKYAGPIGQVVTFRVPEKHADRFLHPGHSNLDETATHYPLRRTLPAKYIAED